jgi:hypothetical protein
MFNASDAASGAVLQVELSISAFFPPFSIPSIVTVVFLEKR